MLNLAQSSPELEAELRKLVMLVHCHHHDCGRAKESRIEEWTAIFPGVLSVENKIKKTLGQVSTTCAGIAADGEPCQCKIKGWGVEKCRKTIATIVRPEVYLNDANLGRLLDVLAWNKFCCEYRVSQNLKAQVRLQ
jgi:hypothetical protein